MRSGGWSEYLSVLVACVLVLGLFGLHAHATSGRTPQGEARPDALLDQGALAELPGVGASGLRERAPLQPEEEAVVDAYERSFETVVFDKPHARQRHLAFITFDIVLLKSGRYLEYASRLEAVLQATRLLERSSDVLPAPAARALEETIRNARGVFPYVARARWRLGLWEEAMELAEEAFLEQPRNPDAVMMYAFLLAQRDSDEPLSRVDALTLRNLFARVVELDPEYVDEGFSLTAELLRDQIKRVDKDLAGFTRDPVAQARAVMRRHLKRPFDRLAAIERVLGPILTLRDTFTPGPRR